MILTRPYIRLFRKLGLVVIEPFDDDQLQTNSYDVTLWHHFWRVEWRGRRPHYEYVTGEGRQIIQVPHGGTLLAATREVIGGRWCVVPSMRGKSSIRRMGITVCGDAGLGDLHYVDHWTAELTALVHGPTYLEVGKPFAQMVFHLALPTRARYAGQYTERDWPGCMVPARYEE